MKEKSKIIKLVDAINEFDLTMDTTTDIHMALRVLHFFGKKICYCEDAETWYIWNGQTWEEDNSKNSLKVRTLILQIVNILEARLEFPDKELQKYINTLDTGRKLTDILAILPIAHVRSSRFKTKINNCYFATKNLFDAMDTITLKNGTFYLSNMEFKEEFRQDNFATKQLNFDYDPEARGETWEKSLHIWTDGNEDYKILLQTIMGKNFLAGTNREQTMTFLLGKGGAGKSFFMEALQDVMDTTSLVVSAEKLYLEGDRRAQHIAEWEGRKHIIFSETDTDKESLSRFNQGAFKNITGDCKIEARRLFGRPYIVDNKFNFTLVTNYDVRLNNWDKSITRRLQIYDWVLKDLPPNLLDINLKDKLKQERAGIFNWIIEGYKLYLEHGIIDRLGYLEKCKREYIQRGDKITQFVVERLTPEPMEKILFNDLYIYFVDWIADNYKHPITKRKLATELRERGYKVENGGKNKVYLFGFLVNAQEEF